ncbi:MAG: hypothetical protein EA362_12165 [Saprospirales bacterium]|nr:MAG: hypothetical protein EA362_12165 [Saprospirales bacterium]
MSDEFPYYDIISNNQIEKVFPVVEFDEENLLAPGRFHLVSFGCAPVDEQICCCFCVGAPCGIMSAVCEIPAIQFACYFGGPFECTGDLGCDSVAEGADCYTCCSLACGA